MRGLKFLKSLGSPNQSFRGSVSYQWLEADFVSLLAREAFVAASAMRQAKIRALTLPAQGSEERGVSKDAQGRRIGAI
jgi:hypothetical protein